MKISFPSSKLFLLSLLFLCVLCALCGLFSSSAFAAAYTFTATSTISSGDVVVFDPTTAYGVKTTTNEGDPLVAGVSTESATATQECTVRQDGGRVTVNVTGTVGIGDYLITSTTAGKAKGVANLQDGIFGIAVTNSGTPGAGQVYASIFIGYGGGGTGGSVGGLADLNDVGTVDYVLGHVLIAGGSDYDSGVLSHTYLSDKGTNTHAQLDSHVGSTSNPHSVTAAQAGAVAKTGDENIDGIKTFLQIPRGPATIPTMGSQYVTKDYADALNQGLIKQSCVVATTAAITLSNQQTIDDVYVVADDRVLVKDQADQTTNGIYKVVNGGSWTRATDYDESSEVQEGTFTFIVSGTANGAKQFAQLTKDPTLGVSNLVFTQLGSPSTYVPGDGLDIAGGVISVDLMADGGLQIVSTELAVKPDDSTIENSASGIRIKDLGVTYAKLAGSIPDSKLDTISTADKVLWAAIDLALSSLNDIADVYADTPSDGQALAWSTSEGAWVPTTISGAIGDSGETLSEIDFVSDATVYAEWTNMPAASTELFGNSYSRVKIDLSSATQYRLVANLSQPGTSGADLNLQYSTDNITYQAADTGGAGEMTLDPSGIHTGAWTNLVAGAKAEVYITLIGKDGNATNDPRFRRLAVQFKFKSAGAPYDAKYLVQTSDPDLPNAQNLSALSTGLAKITTGTGIVSTVAPDTGYFAPDTPLGVSTTEFGYLNGVTSAIQTQLDAKASSASAVQIDVAAEIYGLTEKTEPIDTDIIIAEDCEDSHNKKKMQLGNLPFGNWNIAHKLHWHEEFLGDAIPDEWTITVSGSGSPAAALLTGASSLNGVVRITGSTSNLGNANLTLGDASYLAFDDSKNPEATFYIKAGTLTDDDIVGVGFSASTVVNASNVDHAIFTASKDGNSGNWVCQSGDGSGTETHNTTISAVAWHTLKIVVPSGGAVQFYIDGVLEHTAATEFPTDPMLIGVGMVQAGNPGTAGTVDVDAMDAECNR